MIVMSAAGTFCLLCTLRCSQPTSDGFSRILVPE